MRDNIQEIKVDKENKIIKCGNLFEIDEFIHGFSWYDLAFMINVPIMRNLEGRIYSSKQKNKKMTEILGMPPKKYTDMIRGAMYNLWIKDNHKLMSQLCMSRVCGKYKFDPDKLRKFHNNIEIIKQYESDGLFNLIPFAYEFGKTTKYLKNIFGKSLWKSLCKNSFTRNKLISSLTINYDDILALNEISSSVLKNIKRSEVKVNWYINVTPLNSDTYYKSLKKLKLIVLFSNILREKRDLKRMGIALELYDLIVDTHRMSIRMNVKFDTNWTFKQLHKKHDEYTKLYELNKYPDTKIEQLNKIKIKEYKNDKYIGKLIDTPFKLKKQGMEQKHCVASYLDYIQSGEYLVYDIKQNNKTVSTLGININDNKYQLSQHYKACNEIVDQELKEFGYEIVNQLNKENSI